MSAADVMDLPGSKQCATCRTQKPLAAFGRTGSGGRYVSSYCRPCRAASERARRRSGVPAARARAQRAREPERFILRDIIRRCTDSKRNDFHHYGGRGISVSSDWQGEGGFDRFLAHIGPRPSVKHSVDRIDNSRGYEPGNVRWATQQQQCRNQDRTRLLTADGRTQCMTAWCEELGAPGSSLVFDRLEILGWSVEDAVLTPIRAPRGTRRPK